MNEAKEIKLVKSKKSVSYALKAARVHYTTLLKSGIINKADHDQVEAIRLKASKEYVKQEYGL